MTDAPEALPDTADASNVSESGGPVPLLDPREGIPPVVADAEAYAEIVARFAAGTGPVAIDAERASGYRYGQRAYLVQLRREGAGSTLIDPVGCPDLSALTVKSHLARIARKLGTGDRAGMVAVALRTGIIH